MPEYSTTVLCSCGCGLPAPLYPYNNKNLAGFVKGEPRRFRRAHNNRLKAQQWRQNFWAKVQKEGHSQSWNGTPCWLWLGSDNGHGYGHYSHRGEGRLVTKGSHRIAWELLRGEIPNGYTIDHLCRNHSCVNPDHLEPVPHGVNLLRGNTLNATNAAKTHCDHGHEFTPENTYRAPNGTRHCRACGKRRSSESKARKQRENA